jgi:tetratricopeptide (TPR) repeat protein
MMQEAIYKIQLYLAGEMTPEEMALFEATLERDPELQKLLTTYELIEHSMNEKTNSKEDELKITLKEISKKYFAAAPASTAVRLWPKIMAAAAVLVIVVAVLFVFNNNKQQDLYANYAQHQPLLVQERGKEGDSLANVAATLFNQKRYDEAIASLKEYLSLQPDDQFRLALGIAQIENNDFNDADVQLDSLVEKNSVFRNEAHWYKVLLELKRKDRKKALEAIEKLPPSSKRYEAAMEIKKKLLKD